MALVPKTTYPTQTDGTDANYPQGKAQDITAPSDGTGTPWVAAIVNDIWGLQQALLLSSAIVPSGSPDDANTSDYLDALNTIFAGVGTPLNASEIVETDVAGLLQSVAKAASYNKPFGTGAGTVAEGDDSRFATIAGALNDAEAFFISHTLANTTAGGSSASTTWTVCPYNVEDHDTLTVTLAANQFVLPAGDYIVDGYHAFYNSGRVSMRLYNTTGAASIPEVKCASRVSGTVDVEVSVDGRFTIAAAQTLQFQYYAGTGKATDGLGLPVSSGEQEVYGFIKFFKVG